MRPRKKRKSKASEKGTFRTSPDFPDKITEPSTELSRSELSEAAASFARKSRAKSTLDSYRKHWRYFANWCVKRELEALPASPETVAAYLSERGFASVVTS